MVIQDSTKWAYFRVVRTFGADVSSMVLKAERFNVMLEHALHGAAALAFDAGSTMTYVQTQAGLSLHSRGVAGWLHKPCFLRQAFSDATADSDEVC